MRVLQGHSSIYDQDLWICICKKGLSTSADRKPLEMPRNRNLLAKLGAEKGRDIAAEKRKKEAKVAEKRKRQKNELSKAQEALLDGETEVEDVNKVPGGKVRGSRLCERFWLLTSTGR